MQVTTRKNKYKNGKFVINGKLSMFNTSLSEAVSEIYFRLWGRLNIKSNEWTERWNCEHQ